MTKRERVNAVLAGQRPDFIPTSFSLHFPTDREAALGTAETHRQFFAETDVDILKVMNEHQTPSVSGITIPTDWQKVPTFKRTDSFIQKQADVIKEICDTNVEDAPVIATIHATCASTVHAMRPQYSDYYEIRRVQAAHYRENPTLFLDGVKRIVDAQRYMIEEMMRAGADGIYFAVLGGEGDIYTAEEFDTVVKAFDLELLELARSLGSSVTLHLCKQGLNFDYFDGYEQYSDIINWGVYENDLSLAAAKELFPNKTLMGGLANRSGVIVEGTDAELTEEIHRIIAEMAGTPFILGADCTLHSDMSYERIHTAVKAARSAIL
ncbi:MAG TPA: uroporphyrinogen decarboxylase family protein [Sphaerochaeta sp.]|nr:uroporphyrinogen decarboxylase family protein [Sphaerochaeta sp.]